ncbi:c-type cytochrome [Aurantimonas marianensis]|uniref:Cytochrome c n=1 Tax=Aurantimonas marianensis TaxID=2920428 RepID=A0A9X2KCX7_9HYPH|nr:c-type cytochrome [Aurantimonas marianensis]MCP3053843.1 cytochrome c [Aurantimonas marianensis]
MRHKKLNQNYDAASAKSTGCSGHWGCCRRIHSRRWKVLAPSSPDTTIEITVPKLSPIAIAGKTAFDANCALCHGRDPAGTDKGPPLVHDIYNPRPPRRRRISRRRETRGAAAPLALWEHAGAAAGKRVRT